MSVPRRYARTIPLPAPADAGPLSRQAARAGGHDDGYQSTHRLGPGAPCIHARPCCPAPASRHGAAIIDRRGPGRGMAARQLACRCLGLAARRVAGAEGSPVAGMRRRRPGHRRREPFAGARHARNEGDVPHEDGVEIVERGIARADPTRPPIEIQLANALRD